MHGNSGRVTTPTVEASEALCRVIWVDAWQDGMVSPAEETRMDQCEHVVYLATAADAAIEASNAVLHRDGIESRHAERRHRELRDRLRVLRERLPHGDEEAA